MLKVLLRLLALLPLPLIHGAGVLFGYLYFMLFRRRLRRARRNLRWVRTAFSRKNYRQMLHASVRETGKGILETFAIWFRSEQSVLKLVRDCKGWGHVEAAHAKGKGIIFLTPHLGCYEITAIYYAARHPISVLYKPPRNPKLAVLVQEGRQRSHITLAPTNMRGIRTLIKTLKQGQAVGILPDQVPEKGEGEWADFFGRPAYTMNLVGKLTEMSGAIVLLAFGERLPWGRGYVIHIEPLVACGKPTEAPSTQDVNDGIERLVRQCPQQYLWSYGRFKRP
jgi:KDO2-lipid IV(A) lauroyltransferase